MKVHQSGCMKPRRFLGGFASLLRGISGRTSIVRILHGRTCKIYELLADFEFAVLGAQALQFEPQRVSDGGCQSASERCARRATGEEANCATR